MAKPWDRSCRRGHFKLLPHRSCSVEGVLEWGRFRGLTPAQSNHSWRRKFRAEALCADVSCATKTSEVALVTSYAADNSAAGWRKAPAKRAMRPLRSPSAVQPYGHSRQQLGSDGSWANAVKRSPTGGLGVPRRAPQGFRQARPQGCAPRSPDIGPEPISLRLAQPRSSRGRSPTAKAVGSGVGRFSGGRNSENWLQRTREASFPSFMGGREATRARGNSRSRRPRPGRGQARIANDERVWKVVVNVNACTPAFADRCRLTACRWVRSVRRHPEAVLSLLLTRRWQRRFWCGGYGRT